MWEEHTDIIDIFYFSPDDISASGSLDYTAVVINLEYAFIQYILHEHSGHIHPMAFSSDRKLLATGDDEAVIF